jgi:hypothetical protein
VGTGTAAFPFQPWAATKPETFTAQGKSGWQGSRTLCIQSQARCCISAKKRHPRLSGQPLRTTFLGGTSNIGTVFKLDTGFSNYNHRISIFPIIAIDLLSLIGHQLIALIGDLYDHRR